MSLGSSLELGLLHQPLRNAPPAGRTVDEQLGDLPTMRLVRRKGKNHLHRADECPVVERSKDHATSLRDLGGPNLEGSPGIVL